ncbi:SGNH/GDSL hydrolase family protein [Devosia sediminis]|uniref:SGNH/GDSL hydrolase family protein n=1 Tax=Devosia sediminis TaxID=2798801 RepID=A0A934MK37_9HYPH|nr:SGNH/GDSL hydrolase family protein [Devosia sediminis]MBJ3784713.1 SGNH/GDSL hydrolase family protein [Devosia sediminis]
MKLSMRLIAAAFVLTAATASAADIVIVGDSTGKGDGAQTSWATRLLEKLDGEYQVENLSRSRNSMAAILKSLETLPGGEERVVILYDRRNAGESVDEYMASLAEAKAKIGDDRLLILPQVPVSGGREDGLTLPVLLGINERLLTEFPENSFDAEVQAAFLEALAGDETRSDRIHRNDVGQEIEAGFIADWLQQAED